MTVAAAGAATSDREVVVTRLFDAPRDLVFEVYTNPEHIRKWNGCGTMDILVCEVDLRPGGRYRTVAREDNGTEHAFSGEYREVVRPERIVNTFRYENVPGAEALETVTFAERGDRTEVTLRTTFSSPEQKAGWEASGAEGGMTESLDRLGEVVRELADPELEARSLINTRVFDAPRELVFRAFTERGHVESWWGPDGFTTTTYEMDVRPGGQWRYMMHGPDGKDWPNRIRYREVVPGERLVYVHDDDGHTDHAPFDVTVTFDDEDGRTRVTQRLRLDSVETRAAVAGFAVEGGRQAMNRLAAYLPTM